MSRMTKKNDWITAISLRLFLPIVLIVGIIFRPCLLSLLYLLLYLYIPFLPVYTLNRGHTHRFLKLTLTLTFLVVIAQIIFQIVLLSIQPYGQFLPDCSTLETLLRHIGFIKINVLPWHQLMRWLAPDAFALVGVLIIYITITNNASTRETQYKNSSIGTYFLLLSLCVTSSLQPSLVSSVYYLVFLFCATCWALCYRLTGKLFILLFILTAFVCAAQILVVYGFQTQWGQELVDADNVWAKLTGLIKIYDNDDNCIDPRVGKLNNLDWTSFVQPITLLILYHIIVYQIQTLLLPPAVQDQVMEDNHFTTTRRFGSRGSRDEPVLGRKATIRWKSSRKDGSLDGTPLSKITNFLSLSRDHTASESTPLMTFPSQSRRYSATSATAAAVGGGGDGHTQTTVLGNQPTSSQPQSPTGDTPATAEYEEEEDYLLATLLNVFDLFAKSSYVATNIIMMTWSITYHSWLTFVLLIGACILWMIPNQRRAMLIASPGLVLYAELLLLAQYIFSLDYDLPNDVNGFDLGEIGFVKENNPWKHILIKSAFTLMFWITLKQLVLEQKERHEERRRQSMLPQTNTSVNTKPATMMRLGTVLRQVMTKFWIWIVAIMLFIIGLGGEKVVLYRIVYMALFLGFILTFQLSYMAWRKMMKIFWLSVIIYSMFVLIMIYTYQFKGIPEYLSNYTGIPTQLQKDIGLETYTTGSLFVRLLTPTFFLIITVIQLHYFHRDFLLLSERRREVDQESRRRYPSDPKPLPLVDNFNTKNLIANFNYHGFKFMQFLSKYYKIVSNLVWRFLDIHIFKIVFFSSFLLTVYDPSSLHFLIFIAVICALTSESVQSLITHICSIYISILLLGKMIYQIDYIKHEQWQVNCTIIENNVTKNNAEWLGFRKSSNLPELLKGYIGLILVLTIKAVVQNSGLKTFGVLFPRIKRNDADKNLVSCLKYLANYCFYKFGVEITLITIVAVIGRRLDVFSVLYAFWLIPMFMMNRARLATIWLPFIGFIAVLLPIQYLACIGLPPSLCPEYPWETWPYFNTDALKSWLFLPYLETPPVAARLIPDFFLLLFASQQQRVFWIEKTTENYAGGSNKELGVELYIHPSENPTPDFITTSRSWLDTIKRRIFLTFYWFTLLAIFLTGTTRVNVFALGYLISSFIFLWEGNDFYLRSKRSIIKNWNFLLGYNVFVVFSKSIIQLIGCVFASAMQYNFCWVVQIFGIACLKFGPAAFRATAVPPTTNDPDICRMPHEEAGLLWDGIAFAFLLLQRRIFNSYYFFHIRNDTEAQNQLASRGAELIGELKQKQIRQQGELERQVLEKIKTKMDKIKAVHEKGKRHAQNISNHFDASSMIGSSQISLADDNLNAEAIAEPKAPLAVFTQATPTPSTATNTISVDGFFEPPTYAHRGSLHPPHFSPTDESFPVFSPPPTRIGAGVQTSPVDKGDRRYFSSSAQSPALSHHTSIRSGDYYMFDEYDEEEEMCMIDSITEEDEDEKEGLRPSGVTVSELMASALKSGDVENAAEMAKLARQPSEIRDPSFDESSSQFLPSSSLRSRRRRLSRKSFKGQRPPRRPRDPMSGDPDASAPLAVSDGSGAVGGGGDEPPGDDDGGGGGDMLEESDGSQDQPIEPRSHPTFMRRVIGYLKFAWLFIESVLTSMTGYLNKFSRDYRHVARSLAEEKLLLKTASEKEIAVPTSPPEYKESVETGQEPHVLVDLTKQPSFESEQAESKDDLETVVEKRSPPLDEQSLEEVSVSEISSDEPEYPPIVLFLIAISYVIISHSDLLCYFIIFLTQINSASILSLPLPLMVLLWGSLSVPRPTKTFWVTIIAYTEAMIVIKYLFQFDFFNWEEGVKSKSNPFSPPKILGIQKQAGSYATYDVILLMVVFFHRYMLKSLGLWKNMAGDGDNEETSILIEAEHEQSVEPTEQAYSPESSGSNNLSPGLNVTVVKLCVLQYLSSIKGFFDQILNLEYKVKIDVYSYMFMCDFFNFLVIIFGFASFGSQTGDVAKYLEENKVPVPFLVMVITQFALIIIDRALYLRKYILGKFFFQICLVIGVHLAMFFLLPWVTERDFNAAAAPQLWYVVKCIYLLLSAYQIRCGYPTRILGNFLCKKYNYVNMFLFKGFMAVPFLFELRALMDWIWTDTSMTLSDWLKLEDIFAHIFQLKCQRRVEKEYPQGRGLPKARWSKYAIGGSALFIIIAIIWFPLVLFALGNTIGIRNTPDEVSIELSIGSYQPIFTMSTQSASMIKPEQNDWDNFNKVFRNDRGALNFLSNYDHDDVAVAIINGNSESVWGISPPAKIKLINDLNDPLLPLKLRLTYNIRPANISDKQIIAKDKKEIDLLFNSTERNTLSRIISSDATNETTPVILNGIFPKFVKVTSAGKASAVEIIPDQKVDKERFVYRSLSLTLNKADGGSHVEEWWDIKEICEQNVTFPPKLDKCSRENKTSNELSLFTFNDKAFPSTLTFLSGPGIIGLYTTLVLVASKFVRNFFSGISFLIMFDDMPNVDRVFQLCLDIYLVRESGELALEEDLFAKLIFLYRSPETLIKWTRPKVDDQAPGQQQDQEN